MTRDVLDRVAFAIQDESMTRLQAQRYARAALDALLDGDSFNGLIVRSRDDISDAVVPFALPSAPNRNAGL